MSVNPPPEKRHTPQREFTSAKVQNIFCSAK